jgi:hypothetical protein
VRGEVAGFFAGLGRVRTINKGCWLVMKGRMPDSFSSRARASFRTYFTPRRLLFNTLMVLYCLALFLGFDFLYSAVTMGQEKARSARIADPVYDHGFAANFDGYDIWGEARYRLITNNFGFKDSAVRDVPLKSSSHRILLIGDSFAEGIGMTFDNSFAGLLERAGHDRVENVEFLNAGVASYSPSIYYKKIKYLLERGLQFDEVVLLSDSSDVEDEATSYFCVDDDPKYHSLCTTPPGATPEPAIKRDFFIDHFVVTNRLRVTVKRWIQSALGNRRRAIENDHNRIGWTTTNPDPVKYRPLGIDGGIARSLQNMTKLSDLLASRSIPLTIVVYPLGPADRAERPRRPPGRAVARFLPRPLQGVRQPVSGVLRCRRQRQGLVRAPLHPRRRPFFGGRQPDDVRGAVETVDAAGLFSPSRSWRRRAARCRPERTDPYRISSRHRGAARRRR